MNIYSLITFIVNKVKNVDKIGDTANQIKNIMYLIVFIVIIIFILLVVAMINFNDITIANSFITLHR